MADKPKVYFSRTITPEKVVELYGLLGVKLPGKVAVKVHSGEVGNQNFLHPDFWAPMVGQLHGTVVECNTAYDGERNTTEKHLRAIAQHGWNDYFDVDLMDAEGPDLELPIPNGLRLKKNFVGKNLAKYDSMLVLSHFKGHPMGGFGGALKQLSIGVASSYGKAYIHGVTVPENIWTADHDQFLESMADAASSVVDFFAQRGGIAYVNVMKNMSVDCDCCAVAEDPCMADIGILVSTDPVAIDQACLDLVYAATDDPGRDHLIERIESRNGVHTVEAAAALGVGSREYELVEVEQGFPSRRASEGCTGVFNVRRVACRFVRPRLPMSTRSLPSTTRLASSCASKEIPRSGPGNIPTPTRRAPTLRMAWATYVKRTAVWWAHSPSLWEKSLPTR